MTGRRGASKIRRGWRLVGWLACGLVGATPLLSPLPVDGVEPGEDAGGGPLPLVRAHAHNDYEHARPLEDALAHGFCSVEADVFLVDGELLVAHDREKVDPARTLEGLYLEPLRRRAAANGGRVFRGGPCVTLLVDVKSEASSTYEALEERLRRFRDLIDDGALTVIVSGNRAAEAIAADPDRLAGIDGRLVDLDAETSPEVMPLISDRWTSHFAWRGDGPMPAAERARLRSIVAAAHAAGRRVRFWATPEEESVWRELAEAGVDLINTDALARLAAFLGELEGAATASDATPEPAETR